VNIINTTIIMTLFVAIMGALIASKLKIPAGNMIGAMFFVALLNIITGLAAMPAEAKTFTQIIAGLFIGSSITRKDVLALRSMIKPAILTVFLMLCFSLTMGFVIYKITPYDLVTAMLASAPGGIVDMALIGYDMGADTSVVSILQLVRLLSVMGLFPTLINYLVKLIKPAKNPEAGSDTYACIKNSAWVPPDSLGKLKAILRTALVSLVCGLMGSFFRIPAGAIVFSMIGVAAQNIFWGNVYMPSPVRSFAQVCAGTLIGVNVTFASILHLRSAIIPAIILIIGFAVMTLITSMILYKNSSLDRMTCFFACVPGGATDICLLAGDFGADTAKIIVIQLLRLVCVIAFYPMIISLIHYFS
jgi:membrane AbrB-like protein